jgi:hypothetical protein
MMVMATDVDLAWNLGRHGLPLVAVPEAGTGGGVELAPADLIEALVSSRDPLFVPVVVPCLLFLPAAGGAFDAAGRSLAPPLFRALRHMHVAAVAMGAQWRTRLRLAGVVPPSDRFAAELGLPDPAGDYGEPCLSAVWDRFESGEAGVRLRGVATAIPRLVDRAFEVVERERVRAPAR